MSDQFNDRRYILDEFEVSLPYNAGQWYNHSSTFQIDLNNPTHVGNDWFAITGQIFSDSDYRNYTYFDDVRLYRPCDDVLECVPAHGQICPSVATMQAPGDLLRVGNISNASDLHLKIYVSNSQIVKDTVYHNANGLPDFRFTRLDLPLSTAVANYHYDLEVTNACGGVRKTGTIQVHDTSAYNPITSYRDTTANWTGVPIPCCLSTLTLQNMQIVGDVSFIVRDLITVQGLVSLAPNSHVTLQAGQVIEITSAEFDGSNSSLEVLEIPCPQRCAQGADCGGGAMVMDAGEFVPMTSPVNHDAINTTSIAPNMVPSQLEAEEKIFLTTERRLSAFPNPFEKELIIGITLPEAAVCSIVIMNLQMHPVYRPVDGVSMDAGSHEWKIDLSDMPSGVYIVQLQANGQLWHQHVVKQ